MNGIAALHRAGIIHCGIKPDRVIILNDSTMKLLLDTGTLRKFSIKEWSTKNRKIRSSNYTN